jgi:hypothetical protein
MGEDFKRAMTHQYDKQNKWHKTHRKDKESIWRLEVVLILIASLAFFLDGMIKYAIWVALLAYFIFQRCK